MTARLRRFALATTAAVLLASTALPALAQATGNPASQASIERLLAVSQTEKMVENATAQMGQMGQGMAQAAGVRPADRPAFDRYMQKVMAIAREESGWQRMKGPMVEIYGKHFSEEEVQGMIAFYESPVGRSMVDKMPAVMADSALLSQQLMQRAMPRIMAEAKALQSELNAQRKKDGAEAPAGK